MSNAEYSAYLIHPSGADFRHNVTGALRSLDIVRQAGAVGAVSVGFTPTIGPAILNMRDLRLVVYRGIPGRQPKLLFDTIWLLRNPELTFQRNEYLIEVKGADLNDLARRRIIAYKSGETQAKKSDNADDMIKEIARENFGASATDTDRDWSSLVSVQPDLSLAPVTSKAFAYRPMIDVFQELCQASAGERFTTPIYLTWDIVAVTEATFQLRTYASQRGTDRRASSGRKGGMRFSPERGNISEARLIRDCREEITYAYAAGQGKGSNRVLESYPSDMILVDPSPFVRIESFVDARQSSTVAEVQSEAETRLREGRAREVFDATLQDTPGSLFDIHYGFGDYVTCQFAGQSFDTRLDVMNLRITAKDQGGWDETLKILARRGSWREDTYG